MPDESTILRFRHRLEKHSGRPSTWASCLIVTSDIVFFAPPFPRLSSRAALSAPPSPSVVKGFPEAFLGTPFQGAAVRG